MFVQVRTQGDHQTWWYSCSCLLKQNLYAKKAMANIPAHRTMPPTNELPSKPLGLKLGPTVGTLELEKYVCVAVSKLALVKLLVVRVWLPSPGIVEFKTTEFDVMFIGGVVPGVYMAVTLKSVVKKGLVINVRFKIINKYKFPNLNKISISHYSAVYN